MMMSAEGTTADQLWQIWRTGQRIAALPISQRPTDRAAGYAAQAAFARHSVAAPTGWKIAATSVAGQRHIGVSGPMLGRLVAETLYPSGGNLPFGANHMRVAEAEFAFRFGAPLPPRAAPYTTTEVLAAVSTLHPTLEIPDSRFEKFATVGEASLIADNACAHQFVMGPAAARTWRTTDLATVVVHAMVSETTHRDIGSNVLGDPRAALVWSVNELSSLGIGIKAWEVVTTGTCVVPMPIAAGDRVEADFGSLGRVACRFST
jgi:2-keto-4-pentenoate hydratase